MKRVLLTLTVLGSLLLGACEKEELAAPTDKTLIKADKEIMCRGCGQWDIVEAEATAFKSSVSTDTIATPIKVVKPGKGRR